MAPNSLASMACEPNNPYVIAELSKPADCEAIRNAKADANRTPFFNNPVQSGSAPQLHNGVARPNVAAKRSCMKLFSPDDSPCDACSQYSRLSMGNASIESPPVIRTPKVTQGNDA